MIDIGTSYRCRCCGVRIEDDHSPFVAYTVTGPVELHPETASGGAFASDYALPPSLRAMLARELKRVTRCSSCHAWDHGEDLVSGPADAPVAIVKHADHQTRATFSAAAQAYHEQQAATRAAKQAADEQARLAAAATKILPPATPATPATPDPDGHTGAPTA